MGYSPKEMIGKKPSFWKMNKPAGFFSVMWRTIYFSKKPFLGELQDKKKNGENFTAEVHIAPVLNNKGRILSFVVIERDITENKKLDTAKKEFISFAAHQLKTPISSIGLAAEMMSRELSDKIHKNSKEYLKMIRGSVKNMTDLVGLFLNVSRMELGTFEISPQMLAMNKIIEENINKIMPQIKNKGLQLKKNIQKDLPALKIDPKIMEIILENIFSNAIKYTEKGGAISVKANEEKKEILIKISDTGWGVPRHQQPFIFEKMFRADNVKNSKEGGTGLGLYLVKSLVEQIGGRIWHEPKNKKGTTICLALPKSGMVVKTQNKK
ncbi:MAG: PAS domain-containing sensor histidine kinase, partial [Candidatus Staskawiczbacteria bacterium]|nr:PAS domain-containing sensor histidine kinase [Candidatus Staskawiczbacteria bacterium]